MVTMGTARTPRHRQSRTESLKRTTTYAQVQKSRGITRQLPPSRRGDPDLAIQDFQSGQLLFHELNPCKRRAVNEEFIQSRLSRISTIWTQLEQAHGRTGAGAEQARRDLVHRYRGVAYRYILAAVRDADQADDLIQEFAVRVMQGRFRGADPAAGRFRDYLKTALYRLVADHFRTRNKRLPQIDADQLPEPSWETAPELSDACFLTSWREELLSRTWQKLEKRERQDNQPHFTVLKFNADHPQLTSQESADRLSELLRQSPPFTAAGIRKMLQRAREQFARLLVEEVTRSLENPERAEIEQELIDLDLHKYCRRLFGRR